jgi:competence protein ComFC
VFRSYTPIKEVFKKFINFLSGEKCYICGKKNIFICEDCSKILAHIEGKHCSICLSSLQGESMGDKLICGECLKNPPSFKKVFSLFWYEGAIREIVHDIKFKQKYYYLPELFALNRERINNILNEIGKIDYIVPMPLSRKRKIQRGYNQALLIAKELSNIAKVPLLRDFLIKNKELPPLMSLSREERFKYIKGAFSIAKKKCVDTIVLVDDIITTTATIREASKTLKKGGCNEIYVFTICRTKS